MLLSEIIAVHCGNCMKVPARVSSYGICGGQSGTGAGFRRVLRFPLPIFIPLIAPKIILIYHLGLVQ
jgi:hypothetical protein